MGFKHGLAVVAAAIVVLVGAAPADASDRTYTKCAALNRDYPHGVGKPGARDHTSGTPVTNFRRSRYLYRRNDGNAPHFAGEHDLDRDNDGIACEKL